MEFLSKTFQFIAENSQKIFSIIGTVLSIITFLLKTRKSKMETNPNTKASSFIPTLIKNFLLWILKKFDVWVVLRELNDNWRDKAILTKTPADD
jgi:hypothetical protein